MFIFSFRNHFFLITIHSTHFCHIICNRFVHSEGTERKFQCKYCGKKFLIKARLTRHEACHSNERAHVCEICGSAFKHKEGLTKHMKKHNGTETRNHACTQCPLRFPTKYKLDQHMLTHSGLVSEIVEGFNFNFPKLFNKFLIFRNPMNANFVIERMHLKEI